MDARDFFQLWAERLRARMAEANVKPRDVARDLHIGESSLRKRFRGEVPFSAEEVFVLSERFDLPRSAADLQGQRLDLHASASSAGPFDEGAYVRSLHHFTRLIVTTEGEEVTVADVSICAADIPIHQLFGDPVLTALKLYFFDTASENDIRRRFDLSEALERQRELLDQAAEVYDRYARCNSVEVWGRDPLGSFLHQIIKHARAYAISGADLKIIFSRLEMLVERIGREARAARKSHGGRFELHQNWLFANKTIFLIATPTVRYSFLTIANPHYLYSTRDATYAFFTTNVDAFRRQSVRVSGTEAVNGGRFEEALKRGVTRAEAAITTFREAEEMI